MFLNPVNRQCIPFVVCWGMTSSGESDFFDVFLVFVSIDPHPLPRLISEASVFPDKIVFS